MRHKKDKKSNKQQKPSLAADPKAPPPLKTPLPLSNLKGVDAEKKKRKEEESDNTLTDIPQYMPDMELEDFDIREQLILDEHLL